MLRRLIGSRNPVYVSIPALEDDFSCNDFHPALYELAALKETISID
jgi:hypothetical protein